MEKRHSMSTDDIKSHSKTFIFIFLYTWWIFISWFLICIGACDVYFLWHKPQKLPTTLPYYLALNAFWLIHHKRREQQMLKMFSHLTGIRLSLPPRKTRDQWVKMCSHNWWDRFVVGTLNHSDSWYIIAIEYCLMACLYVDMSCGSN